MIPIPILELVPGEHYLIRIERADVKVEFWGTFWGWFVDGSGRFSLSPLDPKAAHAEFTNGVHVHGTDWQAFAPTIPNKEHR
jgi:hypothetical protein